MESQSDSGLSYAAIALATAVFLLVLRSYDTKKFDAREPPVVPATIPFVGHLLGMLTYGSRYFKTLGYSRHRYPIFTLPTLNSRTYIVTEPSLAASVQRASKTLSFNPVIPEVTQRVLGFDAPTIQLMRSDMEHGFVQQIQELVHSRLSPGDSLDEVTVAAGNEFLKCLDALRSPSDGSSQDLLKWVKNIVTIATANFMYGPKNPINESPGLTEEFWDFDNGIPGLLVGLVPSITAKKAYKGRESVVEAFDKFLQSDDFKLSAQITRDRGRIAEQHGVTRTNIARSDLSFLFAGIVNTSLASFWLIVNIFSRPDLLSDIRREIEETLERSEGTTGPVGMSIKRITTSCPLLTSSFRETLRLYSDNFSTRVVTEDTLLADTYFLRKGAIVQVSGGIIHSDERIWGKNVDSFDPRRFLSKQPAERSKGIHPAAFRAFGGGSTLCPGRHFALNEIVGFAAMVVLLFDVSPPQSTDSHGPRKKDNVVPIHVLEPLTKVSAEIEPREGWEDVAIELHK